MMLTVGWSLEALEINSHEYPNNEGDVIEGIYLAMDAFLKIEKLYLRISLNIKTKKKRGFDIYEVV